MSKTLLRFGIVLFGIFFNPLCRGQGYQEGYLVTSKGDTIRGYLSISITATRNEVRYRDKSESKNHTVFPASGLKAMHLSKFKENYISQAVKIDMKPVEWRELDKDDPEPKFVEDTVMLKVLIRGKASLYTYQDKMKQHYFFNQQGAEIHELLMLYYTRSPQLLKVTLEQYKIQMKQEMPGCNINYDLVYFTEAALIKAFKKYNECQGVAMHDEILAYPQKTIYGFAGIAFGFGSFSQFPPDYPTSIDPVVGMGFEVRPGKSNSRFSLCLELFWRTYSSSQNVIPDQFSAARPSTFAFDYFQLPILIKYAIPGKLNPYVKGGACINYITKYIGEYGVTGYNPYTDFKSYSFGFVATAGISVNRFIVEARYESVLMAAYTSQYHIQTGSLMLGYKILN